MKTLFIFILMFVTSSSLTADTFEKVLDSKTLRVGVSLYEPWVMLNEDNELYGYEIQVAEQLANDLGVKAEFKVVEWEELIVSLENNDIDIIISGMAITPGRALRVNFTNPYGESGVSIAANIEKTKDIKSLKELNSSNVVIGVVSNTVSVAVASQVFAKANVKSYVKSDEAVEALLSGNVHALVESSPMPKFLSLEYPDIVDAPLKNHLLSYKTGMAVTKNNQEFLNYLNSWIISRDAEGWLPAKHKYWFDSLEWKNE